jgi:ABC-type cobalamin/Fe3+-siderophores transport system ATPase subunit/SAM-dependent methyltransferase
MSIQRKVVTGMDNFQKAGLKNVEQVVFSRKNLVIGKNGSGKTRFLKALETGKREKAGKEIVITLYFSEIQSYYNKVLESQEKNPDEAIHEIYPYDLLLEDDESSFFDFLQAMEKDHSNFLRNILSILSMKRTKKNTRARATLRELNELMMEFLEKRIKIDSDEKNIEIEKVENETVIRSLPLEEAMSEFSPGELMLFYLCVFLIIIKRKYNEGIVLIIDEPELHLHPRALVKLIEILRRSDNISELWIATHSLFLVPLFAFEEIIFMQQNAIYSRSSQLYKDLYNSLVGLENISIFDFLESLDNWQYYQFIAECFCLPEPVDKIDINDEQFRKLLNGLKAKIGNNPIQMLDYGAGKCRIWECMQLLPESELKKNSVVYTAYEPYPEEDENRPFKMYRDFKDIYSDEQKFHVVVLMNVLHEIEGKQWEKTFREIDDVLFDDGLLIFLEVTSLSKGEQPYGQDGYLVLQDEQIKILFNDANIVNMKKSPEEKSNCWMITKKQVGSVTKNTINESINALCEISYDRLKIEFQKRIECAHQNADEHSKIISARRYAFLSQQYLNALLTKEILNEWDETRKTNDYEQEADINEKTQSNITIKVKGLKNRNF